MAPISDDALRDLYLSFLRFEARALGARSKQTHIIVPIVFAPGETPLALGCNAEFKRQNLGPRGAYTLLNADEVFSW